LIAASSSTKKERGERNTEIHQTKKANQWYHRYAEGFAYGMEVHIGMDNDAGLIHLCKLLHGEEIGSRMLSPIAKYTGLQPTDL